jgi:thiosulfate/3-mercaptopyruvate sulfurtransferase
MPHTHFTTLISASNLAERLEAAPDSLFIADCSFDLTDPAAGERTYGAGHVPGAHYLHLDRDLSGPKTGSNGRHPLPERDTLARKLAARGLRKGQQVVAYDAQGGMYAARLWWLLRWLGHDSAAVLDGGLAAWAEAGHALVTDIAPENAGDFASADRRFTRGRPLSWRERNPRPGRRTYPRRLEPAVQGQSAIGRALQVRAFAA